MFSRDLIEDHNIRHVTKILQDDERWKTPFSHTNQENID